MGNELTQKPGIENKIEIYELFAAEALLASGTSTSGAVNLHQRSGYFSIFFTITGTGAAKFEYLISHDNVTFVEPASASDIATGKTAGSDAVSFAPVLAPYIKIRVTETGGAQAIGVTLTLAVV